MKKRLRHGGDWAGFAEEYGYEPMDFSMNVNPEGMSDKIKEAIIDSIEDGWKYPDPLCRKLTKAISDYEGCSENHILCGSGAADLIYRAVLALQPRKALVTAPTFGEYEEALSLVDCEIIRYVLNEETGFKIQEDMLKLIDDGLDMIFICEPNNPTGVVTDRELLDRIVDRCEAFGVRMIVDECFNEFLIKGGSHSLKTKADEVENLLILKAFTKCFSMAGIRLGYCICSDMDFIEKMRRAGQPWSVSVIAQAAGIAALEDEDVLKNLGEKTAEERQYMMAEMDKMGFEIIESEANYILFKSDAGLEEELRSKGILIRNCSNYPGLGEGWFRVAVRKRDENMKLMKAMKEWKI